ncbi:MAG: aminopeptidase P family protein [Candidatus Brocadia sp. AMX2]|uniref:Aminopeptidase n=1 Tax=Candidatus Brocadia sinica JPN1 TaxID=1197129 RepID=A0ABQ0JZD0_9BACT|nr:MULTISPECIES: Xaa-Pro peptidase family protein [Brocadia]KXK27875.1 MAG: putative aminopeptidase [Candidatus Brocadia sinica]MBC6933692.1 aminopeptidase P family protein [Candidatus Brocadia sp.]MBL1170483.1 aminopeptidase P family protein [Candidatus Brocadia sp. AMX1]NOG40052.1 aminopeptidase P family protein [Planctomycetota bacterium]KAA0243098.1 MAG: aminopeptidase P family protein [Candidatus Brocadia sp. AMX2]
MHCLSKLKEELKGEKVDGFLVTNEVNVRYVTNFTGSESILLITPDHDYLFTDFRYVEQARLDIPWIKIVERKVSLIKTICGKLKRLNIKSLYVESLHLTLDQYNEIISNVKGIQIIPTKGIIEKYRKCKTREELEKIRTAIDIAERAYYSILEEIKIGVSEKRIADLLEFEIRNCGGGKGSFETICATGPRASQPHARTSDREIQERDAILIDWGVSFQFYNSDLTRIRFMDKISAEFKKIYQIVLDAQHFAIDSVRPGQMAKDIDGAARNYIKKKGFGKCFGHGVGHGIGLEVHEGPTINSRSKEILEEDMIFTIEPGIYIPGWGGVRIEDMVLVTSDGCDVLSRVPKKLTEIVI